MKTENQVASFEILWINTSPQRITIDFSGWSINLNPNNKTPSFLLTEVDADADGDYILEVNVDGQGPDYVKWEPSTNGEYQVFEKSPDAGTWQQLLSQSVTNPLYIFYMEEDADGIVIVGTIETGVDPINFAAQPVAAAKA